MTEREQEIRKAIEHFKYGVTHDIFSEPVTTYAMLAVEALEKMAYAEANTEPEGIRFIRGKKSDKELADEVFHAAHILPFHQRYPIWELVGRFRALHNQKMGKKGN